MASAFDENFYIFRGFHASIERARSKTHNLYYKVISAQRYCFFQSTGIHFSESQEKSIELLDEAMHKFYLGTYSLEQLWGAYDYLQFPSREFPDLLDINLTTWQNEIVFLLSSLLDQSLFTWRSFLDYYMKYLLYYCTDEYIPTMSMKNFKRIMGKYIHKDNKTSQVYEYLRKNVLCNSIDGIGNGWGDYLKELRDKTTHQKLIRPEIFEKENSNGYHVTWPTINGQNYSDLVQLNFENRAFEMIRDLFPILYGLEWISGPYKPGMFLASNNG